MNYIIEFFEKATGKRYHYSHSGEDKISALRKYLRVKNDCFGAPMIVVLFEVIGHRRGCLGEGVYSVGIKNCIAVKGANLCAKNLTTFCMRNSDPYTGVDVFLREKS